MSLIQCPECAREISDSAVSCPHCGFPLRTPPREDAPAERQRDRETAPAPAERPAGFAYGIWGFVLALISLLLPVPYLDMLLAVIAFIFSMLAITRTGRHKGLAIAGVVISILSFLGALAFWSFLML